MRVRAFLWTGCIHVPNPFRTPAVPSSLPSSQSDTLNTLHMFLQALKTHDSVSDALSEIGSANLEDVMGLIEDVRDGIGKTENPAKCPKCGNVGGVIAVLDAQVVIQMNADGSRGLTSEPEELDDSTLECQLCGNELDHFDVAKANPSSEGQEFAFKYV